MLFNIKKFFKISFFFLLFNVFLFAMDFNQQFSVNMQNQYNQDLNNIKKLIKNSSSDYKSMILYYSHSDDPRDWFSLGVLYLFGSSIPDKNGEIIQQNIKKAEYWLIKAMKNKFYTAGILLASYYMYNPNYSSKKEYLKRAKEILTYLLNQGYYDAVTYLADYYRIVHNYKKFINTLIMGNQYNNANAQLSLALLYYYGFEDSKTGKIIIKRNYQIANYYLTRACTNPNKNQYVTNFCNPEYNKYIVYSRKKQ